MDTYRNFTNYNVALCYFLASKVMKDLYDFRTKTKDMYDHFENTKTIFNKQAKLED